MDEELSFLMETIEESMQDSVKHLEESLAKVRAGKASPAMISDVKIKAYGADMPINQVANVTNLDQRTLAIQPWDKSNLPAIEKAIFAANLGITPQSDGEMVRLTVPPLTEERRKDLAKKIKSYGEDSKISIRNARKEANQELKQMVKDGLSEDVGKTSEGKIQDLTKKYGEKVDKLVKSKEQEVMSMN